MTSLIPNIDLRLVGSSAGEGIVPRVVKEYWRGAR